MLVRPDDDLAIPGDIHAVPFYLKTDKAEVTSIHDAWNVGFGAATEILFDSTRAVTGVSRVGYSTAVADGTSLRDRNGAITNMADHDIFAGRNSIDGVIVVSPMDVPVTPVADAGVGSTYGWGDGALTQTMLYTPL